MKIILALLLLSGCMPNSERVKQDPVYQAPPQAHVQPYPYCEVTYWDGCGLHMVYCSDGHEYHCVQR